MNIDTLAAELIAIPGDPRIVFNMAAGALALELLDRGVPAEAALAEVRSLRRSFFAARKRMTRNTTIN